MATATNIKWDPPSITELRSLHASIGKTLDAYDSTPDKKSDTALEHLTDISTLSEQLSFSTRYPLHYLWEKIFGTGQLCAVKCAIDCKAFVHIPEEPNGDISLNDLASKTGVESELLVRILRILASMRLVKETGLHQYTLTQLGAYMKTPKWQGMFWIGYDYFDKVWWHLPDFLANTGWKNPVDTNNNPHKWAFQTNQGVFEWHAAEPKRLEQFYHCMSAIEDFNGRARIPWDRLIGGVPDGEVAMIDCGGGDGPVLKSVLERFPDLTGRFVLQDLPHTIQGLYKAKMGRIEAMEYSFFEEQPLKGARAYHFRHVFHDWPEADCKRILRTVKQAMKPGYSQLFLSDVAAPDVGASMIEGLADFEMMCLGACERTVGQWKDMLESEGFVIKEIIHGKLHIDGFIVAELARGSGTNGVSN